MNFNPFVNVLGVCVDLYRWAVLAWITLSILTNFHIINPYQPLVYRVRELLDQLVEPVLQKIRRFTPEIRGIDLSSLVLLILLGFIKEVLYTYFYRFSF